jgi:glycosyltransferase involved in cell wall biosynthesis
VSAWSLAIRLQILVSVQIERKILATADQVVAVASSVAGELAEYGLSGEQVQVLGNGTDTDLFCPNGHTQPERHPQKYIFAASRLDVRKGLEDLIDSMRYVVDRFSSVHLCIAGDGPLRSQLEARAKELGLEDRVRFLGHITDRGEMVRLYRNATLFAHAAHYEGLPTVLLEAMACAKAVVSTSVSGALDVISDEVNGILVPPRAPDQLANAVCRLLGDRELRDRLGSAARQTVEERYSWRVVGKSYVDCYHSILEKAQPRLAQVLSA